MIGRGPADWMCTFSGVQYYPAAPRMKDVRIVDIAHALSMLCRYTGHCRQFYSVAEHSVHVSHTVPAPLALLGLMHDATEAYVNDLSSPLKRSLPDYKMIEAFNWVAIARRFGLPEQLPRDIHLADMAVLRAEQAALMPPLPADDGLSHIEPAPVTILALAPAAAEALFLERFYELTRAQGRR
jgi:hypothetical protein